MRKEQMYKTAKLTPKAARHFGRRFMKHGGFVRVRYTHDAYNALTGQQEAVYIIECDGREAAAYANSLERFTI